MGLTGVECWFLSFPLPAGPARVLSESVFFFFFFYLGIDKASCFSKSIYLALWLWGGLDRYGSKGEEDCLERFFFFYNKLVWKLCVLISFNMNLSTSRIALGIPLTKVISSISRGHFCCWPLDADRFCPRAMSSTAVKFNNRNQSTKALSLTPQTIQCQRVQEFWDACQSCGN